MKRSHSDMATSLSALPAFITNEPNIYKSNLSGSHVLRVAKVADISKPTAKPIEEIEEPEEEDAAVQNRLSKSNARMLQLNLVDSNKAEIKALEVEYIDVLTSVKPNCIVNIVGPVDIRCGNLMLRKRHVKGIEAGPPREEDHHQHPQPQQHQQAEPATSHGPKEDIKPIPIIDVDENWDDWEEDDEDCIILD